MKKNISRKSLVFAVTVLFVGSGVISGISGNIKKLSDSYDVKEKVIFKESKAVTVDKGRIKSTSLNLQNTLYVGGTGPNNYSSIQSAINDASNYDTVFVYDDSAPYYENVVVDKTIVLLGENKFTTFIDGTSSGDVVYVSADHVKIMGFSIQNGGDDDFDSGIKVCSDYNTISGNFIHHNGEPYIPPNFNYHTGIYLESSSHNDISNNRIYSSGQDGIFMDQSDYNTIHDNEIYNNEHCAIVIDEASHNIVIDNDMHNSLSCISFWPYSTYNEIRGNNIYDQSHCGMGIWEDSNYNTIRKNTIHNNSDWGIRIRGAKNNVVEYNTISGCSGGLYTDGIGLYLDTINNICSNDNNIYHNTLIDNVQNAYDECSNAWDNGGEGNYWDDYNGTDTNGDGIGDIPYLIPGGDNEDNYPLMTQYGPPHAEYNYVTDDKSVLFNASLSYDYDGNIISYAWDFGDGEEGAGIVVSHIYSNYGTYNVTLTITDNNSSTDSISKDVTVSEELVADANGPYEAFEDEAIQFQGSADGGEPPYSFHWDFGNGDMSDEEDPVYAYDEPGIYEVTLTVTDSAKNTAIDATSATINEMPCCFEVLIPPGINIGLNAEVTEICEESHTGVPWKFEISGGIIVIPISPLNGIADFSAGETKTFKAPLVIGLGNIQITFTIGEYCNPTIVNAFILGPIVIIK